MLKKNKILIICILFLLDVSKSQSEQYNNVKEEDIEYSAVDSIIYDIKNQKVLLYNNAKVKSKNTELKAGFISIDFVNKIIFAKGIYNPLDIYGQIPILKENGKTYEADTITYNYKSKKAKIHHILTEENGGYLHGKIIKKQNDETYFLKYGKYTTCNLDEPHFYINANKLKLITNEKIITGPANLILSDLPTPLFIPFGIFPISTKRASGIILPSYGESVSLGFNLQGLGYHFSISDHVNITLNSDLYTKGSWRVGLLTNYAKRYKYKGDININIAKTKIGEIGRSDYSLSNDFKISWQHKQDPKAHPNQQISALVNIATSTYLRNNSYNNEYLNNTLSSNVSFYRNWNNKPYNLSINLRHNQNTITKQVNLTLPEMSFSINRRFPFKNSRKKSFYKNIGVSYNVNTKTVLSGVDSLIFTDFKNNIQSGVQHKIPISTSFNLMKYLNVSPSINYTERWYFKKNVNMWNNELQLISSDTLTGFWAIRDFNMSTRISTKIYGFINFKKTKFRHMFTPSISYSYKPDFSDEKYNIYYNVQINNSTQQFSYFEGQIYGIPNGSRQSLLNISLANNLEMKRFKRGEQKETKIRVIENLSISSTYNNSLDSLKLSDIYINMRTKLMSNVDIRINSTIDPYKIDNTGQKINSLLISDGKLGRLTYTSLDLNFRLKNKQENLSKNNNENSNNHIIDYNIPWSLNLFYKLNYSKPSMNSDITQSINFNGNIDITSKWKIGLRSGYDISNKSITYTSIDIYRDLHCWEMIFNWIPIGFHQSYNLMIRVKSSVLRDLKITKKKNFYDY